MQTKLEEILNKHLEEMDSELRNHYLYDDDEDVPLVVMGGSFTKPEHTFLTSTMEPDEMINMVLCSLMDCCTPEGLIATIKKIKTMKRIADEI